MRLILSRKGFDSALGGVASPIFPDTALTSLPIPLPDAPKTYAELAKGPLGGLGPIVHDLPAARSRARRRPISILTWARRLYPAGRAGGPPSAKPALRPPISIAAASGLATCSCSSAGFAPSSEGRTGGGATGR